MKKHGLTIDPARMSPGVKALNREVLGAVGGASMALSPSGAQDSGPKPPGAPRRAKEPNQTEREFAAAHLAGLDPMFEGITLRWAGMTYTPDFAVILASPDRCACEIRLYECKGPKVWDDSVVKYKAFKKAFPLFFFSFWQRKARSEPFRRVH